MKMLSLILLINCCGLFTSCQIKPEPEIYLIPKGFTGRVNVIFNQNGKPVKYKTPLDKDTFYTSKLGTPLKYENGKRVYEIPKDGILLTQFNDEYGFVSRQYYYVDELGNREPLAVYNYTHGDDGQVKYNITDIKKVGVFDDGTTGSYGNENVKYQYFVVSNYQNLQSILTLESNTVFHNNVVVKANLVETIYAAPK